MTTLKDIAMMANVSVNTVSRVLNGKSKDIWPRARQQAEEIREIARTLNYIPNSAARAMRTRQFHRVGMVISGRYNAPVDFEIIMGASEILNGHGYSVSVICVDELKDGYNILGKDSLDGIIVRHILAPFREEIKKLALNCIWVETNENSENCCIRRDEFNAGRLAAAKAMELGYRKILFLQQEYHESNYEKHFCFVDRPLGVKHEIDRVKDVSLENILLPKNKISEALEEVYCSKISKETAIIAVDILTAEEITFHALSRGLCAGRDFALISCDERENTFRIWPDLSRVKYNRINMGRRAAEMLLGLINEDETSTKSISVIDEWCPGKTALPIIK